MPIERYTDRVTNFRRNNPNCNYCVCNKNYFNQDRVAECIARSMCCWDPKKIAKKCPIFEPRYFEESEYAWI